MRKRVMSILSLMGTIAVLAGPVQASTVLFNDNFDSDTVGSVSTGTLDSVFTTSVVTNTAMNVVDVGGGNHAITLTDDSTSNTTNSAPYLRTTVSSGISTNDSIVGSFTLTRLPITDGGSEGSFRFLMNTAGSYSTSTTATYVLLRVNGNQIFYNNGSNIQIGLATSKFSLAVGTAYTFEIDTNFSTTVADTWFFRVKDSSGNLLYTSDTFNTSLSTGTPGYFVYSGGATSTPASTNPFVQLDDINFTEVPEPSTCIVMSGMIGVLSLRRRRAQV